MRKDELNAALSAAAVEAFRKSSGAYWAGLNAQIAVPWPPSEDDDDPVNPHEDGSVEAVWFVRGAASAARLLRAKHAERQLDAAEGRAAPGVL